MLYSHLVSYEIPMLIPQSPTEDCMKPLLCKLVPVELFEETARDRTRDVTVHQLPNVQDNKLPWRLFNQQSPRTDYSSEFTEQTRPAYLVPVCRGGGGWTICDGWCRYV